MNIYLLLQIALRKNLSVVKSRIIGSIFLFLLGTTVEILQLKGLHVLGSTFDPLDILMYGIGVVFGLIIDFFVIDKFEKVI